MATLTRCDVCSTEYDPPLSDAAYRVESTKMYQQYGESDRWDICSPTCMVRLASRRDPTILNLGDHSLTDADQVHEHLRWIISNIELANDPDAAPATSTRLLTNAVKRALEAMALVRPKEPEEKP